MLEFTKYLKNKMLLEEHPKILIMLLGQFLKKLTKAEGIKDDEDSIFRLVHAQARRRVTQIL